LAQPPSGLAMDSSGNITDSRNMNTPDPKNTALVPDKIDILPTLTPTPEIRPATTQSVEQQPELQSPPPNSQDRRVSVTGVGDTSASTSHVRVCADGSVNSC
jgi:hypothetical protein